MGVVRPCARFCPDASQIAVEKSMASRTMGECAVRIRISAIWSALDSKALRSTSNNIGSGSERTGTRLAESDDNVVEFVTDRRGLRRHDGRALVLLHNQRAPPCRL